SSGERPALAKVAIAEINAKTLNTRADSGFSPPLSTFPQDMQETVRRSNFVKVPHIPSMYPFVANHEGPLSDDELYKRFSPFPAEVGLMHEIYNRMRPFGIWGLANTIGAVVW